MTTDLRSVAPEDFTPEHAAWLNRELDGADAHEIVKVAVDIFGDTLTTACSFQDLVLLDLTYKIDSSVRVFTLDTGFLFETTEATMRRALRFVSWLTGPGWTEDRPKRPAYVL